MRLKHAHQRSIPNMRYVDGQTRSRFEILSLFHDLDMSDGLFQRLITLKSRYVRGVQYFQPVPHRARTMVSITPSSGSRGHHCSAFPDPKSVASAIAGLLCNDRTDTAMKPRLLVPVRPHSAAMFRCSAVPLFAVHRVRRHASLGVLSAL